MAELDHDVSAMRTDAQIASLLLAFTLPIRRYHWYIDPNGACDEVVEDVANDFNLAIDGQDPKPVTRRRDRFSHDRHLFHALLMLAYGHMFSSRSIAMTMRREGSGSASSCHGCRGRSPKSRWLVMAGWSTSASTLGPVRLRRQDELDRHAVTSDPG